MVRPVGGAISAGSGMVTTTGWQASVEPRVGGADGHGVGVGGLGDHREGHGVVVGRAGLRGRRFFACWPGGSGGKDWVLAGGRRGLEEQG